MKKLFVRVLVNNVSFVGPVSRLLLLIVSLMELSPVGPLIWLLRGFLWIHLDEFHFTEQKKVLQEALESKISSVG